MRRCRKIASRESIVPDIPKGEPASTVSNAPLLPVRIVKDPITGLPVLDAGPNAPTLSSEEVEELLRDFP